MASDWGMRVRGSSAGGRGSAVCLIKTKSKNKWNI